MASAHTRLATSAARKRCQCRIACSPAACAGQAAVDAGVAGQASARGDPVCGDLVALDWGVQSLHNKPGAARGRGNGTGGRTPTGCCSCRRAQSAPGGAGCAPPPRPAAAPRGGAPAPQTPTACCPPPATGEIGHCCSKTDELLPQDNHQLVVCGFHAKQDSQCSFLPSRSTEPCHYGQEYMGTRHWESRCVFMPTCGVYWCSAARARRPAASSSSRPGLYCSLAYACRWRKPPPWAWQLTTH